MKKVIKLTDLDCANCALKMEDSIKKIDGINNANVSFISQKMTLEMDEKNVDSILKQVVKTCKRIEPDCILNM